MLVRYGERLAFAFVIAGEDRTALLRGTTVLAELDYDAAARAVTVVGALNGVEVAELLAAGLRVVCGKLALVFRGVPVPPTGAASSPLRWAA